MRCEGKPNDEGKKRVRGMSGRKISGLQPTYISRNHDVKERWASGANEWPSLIFFLKALKKKILGDHQCQVDAYDTCAIRADNVEVTTEGCTESKKGAAQHTRRVELEAWSFEAWLFDGPSDNRERTEERRLDAQLNLFPFRLRPEFANLTAPRT